jgi:hypothetical protein
MAILHSDLSPFQNQTIPRYTWSRAAVEMKLAAIAKPAGRIDAPGHLENPSALADILALDQEAGRAAFPSSAAIALAIAPTSCRTVRSFSPALSH